MDLLCAMHEQDRCGELRGTSDQLARLARCSTVELEAALADLQNNRAAGVEYRDDRWIVANRRMKKDADKREIRAIAGSKGGSKTQSRRQQNPNFCLEEPLSSSSSSSSSFLPTVGLERVEEFCLSVGIPNSDAEWFYWKGNANGWTNGGKPMRDWKATLRSWKSAGYLPSQKNGSKPIENAI